MKRLLILILCLISGWGVAQDSINLEACHTQAIDNFPLIQQRELLDKITAEKINSLKAGYLPQFNLNGQATYQSDVTELPIKVPFITIPSVDKDSYKVYLDVNQVLWDGGMISKQKDLEQISLKADKQNLEAELYKIKDRVNQIYFSVLLIQKNIKILESVYNDVTERETKLESSVRNGVILESQYFVLTAEKLKIEQQLSELKVSEQAGLEMLGEFTNQKYLITQRLAVPVIGEIIQGTENKRLEPLVMDLQMQRLDVTKQLSSARYMPKIYGFAQAGYGKPGLNMLKSEFDTYWMLGAKFSWNVWNWNQVKKDQKVLSLQKEVINTQKQTFDKNLILSLENQASQIRKNQALLEKDNEIIDLRSKITKSSASQLENGIITSSDYITELNNETQARLNRENHLLQLSKAKIDYLTMKGIY